jgi:Leu/Phe-tRNA-protein transferase
MLCFMPVLRFPNPQHTNADGVVASGGDLHPHSLRLAYRQGIFSVAARRLPPFVVLPATPRHFAFQ